jgi:hypothetical protein
LNTGCPPCGVRGTFGNTDCLTKLNTMLAGDEIKDIAYLASLEDVPEALLGTGAPHRDRAVTAPAHLIK